MDRQVFLDYLNRVAQAHARERDPDFFVVVFTDEIDTMKNWCKQNQYRYQYISLNPNKSCHFYEIFKS